MGPPGTYNPPMEIVIFLVLMVVWFVGVVAVCFLLYGLFCLPGAFRRSGETWLRERHARRVNRIP